MDHEKLARMQNAVRIGMSIFEFAILCSVLQFRFQGIILTVNIG
jgi:hypothetical protein